MPYMTIMNMQKTIYCIIFLNRFFHFEAKDSTIEIIYNKVLAQLGLSAFRVGKFREVTRFLNDLCSYGKTRELLNQFNFKNSIIDTKKKPIPYHQYISID